ncbi:Gamma carbonic anhydrase 3 [Musa troglodytarum]|nr:Gamma carbonic anhydrase 3 [Musa troglodytarum]
MNIFDKVPNVHKDAFVAPGASVIGDVQVGQGSSIWYGCVLRGMFMLNKLVRYHASSRA